MKQKIAFVAIGQAGGNIGLLFEEYGFTVLYLNTSEEDLSTLEKAKYKYHIAGGEGCNKDRRKAKQLIIDDYDQIAAEIEARITADMIFVIFASGGGTGSGAGPMLTDLLLDDGKTVGVITVLPAPEESVKAHMNTYECFSELTKLEKLSACFILDNSKEEKMEINEKFVENFNEFIMIPENNKSVEGNIDRAEVLETLKAHGMAILIKAEAVSSSDIITKIHENIYAPLEADRAVKYITAALSDGVKMSEIETDVGIPIDTFQTFQPKETVLCMSGLSYPQARLDNVYKRVEDNKETIKKNLAATHGLQMKSDINFLEEMPDTRKEDTVKKPISRRDIMSKYL